MQNIQEVLDFCFEHGIQMIDFKMVDIKGKWRHVTIPAARLTEDTMKYGIGFDGSNYGYAAVENSDMVFVPIPESAAIDPFAKIPTLSMTGNVMVIGADNKPFDQYPRSVAEAACRYMRDSGVADRMIIGPEFEFHVFDSVRYKAARNTVAVCLDTSESDWNSFKEGDNNGYHTPGHDGYHADLPSDVTFDLRSKICRLMEDFGVKVKYHHHEVGGSGQLEIEVELDEMVKMADNTMIAKYLIKNEAVREGKTATFMPKPIYGEAGNGMHVHMQLFKDNKPLFYDEKGYAKLSDTAMYFIGGLLSHASSLCAFTNPSTNSYKRLLPGFEAPATIGFATANRSAVIRIPAYAKSPAHKRFELRSPDATCNPYYAYAAILMAGLDGIENKIDPVKQGWGPFDTNLYELPEAQKAKLQHLPSSLKEALAALKKDNAYLKKNGVFPQRLIDTWITIKSKEADAVGAIPHPVEFELYFDN